MVKSLKIVFLFLFAVSFISTDFGMVLSAAEKGQSKEQTKCPVMGGDIDKRYFTDYKGKRIYFCCAGCPDEFRKDPEKYMKKLK